MLRFIDGAHTAFAEQAEQLISPEPNCAANHAIQRQVSPRRVQMATAAPKTGIVLRSLAFHLEASLLMSHNCRGGPAVENAGTIACVSTSRHTMLFHVTLTHSQEDCPGRRPDETPELIGPAERLE